LTGPIPTSRLKYRVEVRENTSDMHHHCFAACREAYPEAAPLKDRQTEFILQPANPALMVEAVRPSDSAARPKLPNSAEADKYRKPAMSIEA
jgi:hypothetical protein